MDIPTLSGGHGRHAVEATRAAVFRAAWGRAAARVGVVALGVLGVVVLSLRAGGIEAVQPLWVGIAAGAVAIAVLVGTAVVAWKKRPAADAIRALLDRRQKLGGLLMADAADGAAGGWAGRLAGVQPVAVRWRRGPTLGLLAAAAAFAVAATLVPIPRAAAGPGALNVDRHVDTLDDQIELLEEEKILEAGEADAMRDAAAAVAEDAAAKDPAATWEALDHLAAELAREGAAAQEQARTASSEAAAAGALAAAMAEANLSAEQSEAAAAALSELAQAAMDAAGGLPPELAGALADAAAAGLDAETLKRLQEMMAGREGELAALMEKLAEAGLAQGKPGAGKPGGGEAEAGLDTAALKEFLEGLKEGECEGGAIAAACRTPGQGGITLGRGDAEMTWTDPASSEGASFDPQVLPPSAVRDPSQSIKLGVSSAAPELSVGGGSAGGALGGVESSGGGSSAAVVLPRHRAAVQRYFERSTDEGSGS